jgi:hypothetical protein
MRRAFPALHAETQDGDTLLHGAIPDQAALHGVLAQVEALGLELLELRRLPASDPPARQPDTPTSAHPADGRQDGPHDERRPQQVGQPRPDAGQAGSEPVPR